MHKRYIALGYTSFGQFDLLNAYDLTQTVLDGDYGALLNSYGKKLKVHIKVDTGINRLGARERPRRDLGCSAVNGWM